MDEIISAGIDPAHAARYIGCALGIVFAAAGGLPMAIVNCLMLMFIDP